MTILVEKGQKTKDKNEDNEKEKNHKDINNTSITEYILQRSVKDVV